MINLKQYLPVLEWGRGYNTDTLANDVLAAVIVTMMLIPQSLAYALLAGLPPQVGLYAAMAPLLVYACFGSSRVLAVGPVAVVSLMTATSIGQISEMGTADYLAAAILLAFMSGVFLCFMGLFRLGFLANFLSHPVMSGFITATGLIIAASQIKHVLGIQAEGYDLVSLIWSLSQTIDQTHLPTALISLSCLVFLVWNRSHAKLFWTQLGVADRLANALIKCGPVLTVIFSIIAVRVFNLGERGVHLVGDVPQGLPPLTLPDFQWSLVIALAPAAVLISMIGFVESVSVAQTLAAKRRQRINPDQELIGLGSANIAAAFTGGYPVTGGIARSMVNYNAGAQTPAAGAFTAIGIGLASLFLTPWLVDLPIATLAATIILAVLSLVDFSALRRAWAYSRTDFAAITVTIALTTILGVEVGISAGVILSLALFLYRTSHPHTAIVGLVSGSQHFRNVERYRVITSDHVITLRVDESLYFANARYLEDKIHALVSDNPKVRHFVLMCPAVNEVDISALEALEAINQRLSDSHVQFHLSEVKGPVMDQLQKSHFLEVLSGKVFLSQYDAFKTLDPKAADLASRT